MSAAVNEPELCNMNERLKSTVSQGENDIKSDFFKVNGKINPLLSCDTNFFQSALNVYTIFRLLQNFSAL